jgi:hypothetical protein
MQDKDYIKTLSALEQAGAHMGPFAAFMHTYHNSLCEAGFTRDEALVLVRDLQTTLFVQGFNLGKRSEEE